MREREREKGVRKNKVDRERNQDFLETSGAKLVTLELEILLQK